MQPVDRYLAWLTFFFVLCVGLVVFIAYRLFV